MTEVYCKRCNCLIGTGDTFALYQESIKSFHFIVKIENRNDILSKLKIIPEQNEKKRKFTISSLYCKECDLNKLGMEIPLGPNAENSFCIKLEGVCIVGEYNGKKGRYEFEKGNLKEKLESFKDIEFRDQTSFYGRPNQPNIKNIKKFIETILPNSLNEIASFNIGSLIKDIPRTYQVELYAASLISNTICYLPTGSGKTMVAAMVAAYMKKLNPNKKVFFICDRIPLVFQQASYLSYQTGLSAGEFCGQNKEFTDHKLDSDILVFTVEFLNNKIFNKKIFIEDCCCLIIDEIHHAINNHPFKLLIERCFLNVDPAYRPRILGLTASPSSALTEEKIRKDLMNLSNLIHGRIYMPVVYENDLNIAVNRPLIEFIEASQSSDDERLVFVLNEFIQPFIYQLNSFIDLKLELKPHLIDAIRNFLNNVLKESNILSDHKRFLIASFLQKILNSLEIISILGLNTATEFIDSCLNFEIENNLKNKSWTEYQINSMKNLSQRIKNFNGVSDKLRNLKYLLRQEKYSNDQSRSIIFVRKRKTARLLTEHLNQDDEIKNYWKPKIFVGHAAGSFEGMDWFEEQEPTLDSFREGKCKLLVSTSVLQEGLDVPACDKVIMFDRMWSLTQYLQSRGRARNEKSQFYVICSFGEKLFYNKLVESEILISKIVRLLMFENYEHLIGEQIIVQINKLIEKTDRSNFAIENLHSQSSKLIRFCLQIYLKSNQKENDLLFRLRSCRGFSHVYPVNDSLVARNLFEQETKVFNSLFEFGKKHSRMDQKKIIFEVTKYILKDDFNCAISIVESNTASITSSSLIMQAICQKIDFGNLTSPFEFVEKQNQFANDGDCKIIIEYNLKCIKVLFFFKNILHKFEIQFDSIDEIVCIDDRNDYLYAYLPCRWALMTYELDMEESSKLLNNLNNVDETYLNWSRTITPDLPWTYRFKFKKEEKFHILEGLYNIKGIRMIFCSVNTRNIFYTFDEFRDYFKSKDFNFCYALECFISQNLNIIDGKINQTLAYILNNLESSKSIRILEKMTFRIRSSRFLNILSILDEIIEEDKDPIDLSIKDLKTVYVRRATITPTRIIYHFPEPSFSNRIIRKYHQDHFLRLRFRDEDQRKLNMALNYSDMSLIYSRILNLLFSGINLCNRKYEFLAMSASQLREHGCWLFYKINDDLLNASKVREWMGDFRSIRCIGKYAARLGQSLSSSIETFETKNFSMIPDIKVKHVEDYKLTEYCFTDGIGKISKTKAHEICKKYYQTDYASAFQIRFAGFKGVVAIDPNLDGDVLQFRPSMKKFESGHIKLDILNVAEYIPCFLNRQIIMILSSLGIPDHVFSNLQDKMLKQMTSVFTNKKSAANFIRKFYRSQFSYAANSEKLDYMHEAFFRDLLKAIFRKQLKDLIIKSRIFVENGRILMGTIDETGLLKENEVFIQCNSVLLDDEFAFVIDKTKIQTGKYFILKSKVAVAKNPCMHPGDVRVLNAVDIPELRHMVNCIVFPSVGNRPITNMCSGSDLDGDLYFVTWEPLLIPNRMEEPMNYNSPPAKEKDSDIVIEDVIRFFVNFIEVDQLGRIANAHVALADYSPKGVQDPLCIKLAKAFSLAVDFPKTGFVPSLPSEIKNIKYPDFMEKGLCKYESEKIIGKMYRKCKKIFLSEHFVDSIDLNPSLVLEGHQEYLDEANEIYVKYRSEIERIMYYFDCKLESNLFIGISSSQANNDDIKDSIKLSHLMIKKLWDYMRQLFFQPFKINPSNYGSLPDAAQKKASAWYVACYSHKSNENLRIISFPWLVEDVIQRFKIRNYDQFSKSVIKNYCDFRNKYQSFSLFVEKIQLKRNITAITGLDLIISGSFGLFLFDENANVHYLVIEQKLKDNKHLTLDKSCLKKLSIYYENISFKDGIMKCEHDNNASFTIYSSKISLLRFIYIRQLIFKNSLLLPLFYTIIHFLKQDTTANILLILNSEKIKIDLFLVFCMNYLIRKGYIDDINESFVNEEHNQLGSYLSEDVDNWILVHDKLFEYLNNGILASSGSIGQILLDFYREMSFEPTKFIFKCKFENKPLELTDKSNELLQEHFFKVFNILSKTTQLSNVWCEKIESNFQRKFEIIKKVGKSRSLFVKDASLLLFSNNESQFDSIEFDLYRGNKRFAHINKECYSAKIERPLKNFTKNCYNNFYLHSLKQVNKAKENVTDFTFRFQVKFGNVYFTNIPTSLLEESVTVSVSKFQEALAKGYKSYNFNLFMDQEEYKNCVNDDGDDNESNLDQNVKNENFLESNNLSDDDFTEMNIDREKEKRKKKKKTVPSNAYSSFDSNIQTSDEYLHNLFNQNEFDSKVTDSYIAYLELKAPKTNKVLCYKIKYDSQLEFIKMKTFPLKWLSIDIRNLCQDNKKKSNKDIRFNLISEKILDINSLKENQNSNEYINCLHNKIKEGILKRTENEDNYIGACKEVSDGKVYVSHAKSIKYNGGLDHWRPIFYLAGVNVPENMNNSKWLEKIQIGVIDSDEFSDIDQDGIFRNVTNRKELILTLKVELNSLNISECREIIEIIWILIKVLSKIIE